MLVEFGGSDNRRDTVNIFRLGSDLLIRSKLGGGHWETLRVPQSSVNSLTGNLGGKSDWLPGFRGFEDRLETI